MGMLNCRSRRWRVTWGLVGMSLFMIGTSALAAEVAAPKPNRTGEEKPRGESERVEVATFGGGCFWCTEAFFRELEGVKEVVSGYSGGVLKNPTYQAVLTGATGHAEVVQITYDPEAISFDELLEVFWKTHDPTTLNRQGPDFGTQYRSVVFYHDQRQRELAEHYKEKLNESGAFRAPIVTEIGPFTAFYPAEEYHQDFYERNPKQSYCRAVIRPKMTKFKRVFKDKLKQEE